MAWFSRRKRPPTPAPEEHARRAERFWQRWFDLLPETSAALGDREPQRVEHRLCELVADVHPDLHFALDRGRRSVYALVVSGQEDPALRPYTDAWKAAAPPDDAIWEYHDSVPPVPDPTEVTVNLGAHRIRLADVRVVAQVDADEGVVDVAVHHPALAELDEPAQKAMTFIPLDATLGERVAAERLRRVETAATEPEGTIGLLELRTLVFELAGLPDPGGPEIVRGAD
ncbi:hypothetical protein [Labedaea rhizosphaerae]|uniref:DUF695 domain-containing protein n=1 Tax=Labedaea rhizosphaerae TaxID=598644 RepID=A0A4R6SDS3_LABRH|nr:hypothetical protein [Labedaea rhizosphaerae]TDP98091.1 hypothetical protein EV186_1031071 [Labedaea rhizosphaerae]